MVGSMLALDIVAPIHHRLANNSIAMIGAASVVVSISSYNPETPFPGSAALVPCLGAAAIIYANGTTTTLVGRILSLSPFVVVGLLSYSLYLWHWPVIVLTRYATQRDPTNPETMLMLGVIVILAVAAWRFIEKPLRYKNAKVRLARLIPNYPLLSGVCLSGAALCFGLALWAAGGLPNRYNAENQLIAKAERDVNPRHDVCDGLSAYRIAAGNVCALGETSKPIDFAVVGDSLGDALAPGIDLAAKEAGRHGILVTRGGCLGLPAVSGRGTDCRLSNDAAFDLIARTTSIRDVLLIDRWTGFVEGSRFGLHKSRISFVPDDESAKSGEIASSQTIIRGLHRLKTLLPGRKLYLLAYLPEQQVLVPQAAVNREFLGNRVLGVPYSLYADRQRNTKSLLTNLAALDDFTIIDASVPFCSRFRCRMLDGKIPLYVDDNHLTASAAIRYRSIFNPFLIGLPGDRS